jgi:hypothetical protein
MKTLERKSREMKSDTGAVMGGFYHFVSGARLLSGMRLVSGAGLVSAAQLFSAV